MKENGFSRSIFELRSIYIYGPKWQLIYLFTERNIITVTKIDGNEGTNTSILCKIVLSMSEEKVNQL